MLKKAVLIWIMLLLLPVAFASTLTIEPVKDQISPYDAAEFLLAVHNTGRDDKFVLSYDDLDWSIHTSPLTDYTTGIFVGAGEDYTTTLLVKPTKDPEEIFKKHSIEIKLKSENTGEELTEIINVNVRKDLIEYPLRVKAEFLMPEEIFPVRTNSIKVRLENTNPLNITEINITLKSSLFSKSTSVDLEPKSEKVIGFSVNLDRLVSPQEDDATLVIRAANATIANITKHYSVVPYGKFSSRTSTEKIFLGERKTITYTNTGNSEQTDEVLIDAGGGFRRLFTSTEPDARIKRINNAEYYAIELTLSPDESADVTVKTSYAPILYIIIILIVAGILYFAFRTPLIVGKEAKEVDMEEGGIARVSILLKLKNRGTKELKNVKVIEKVPSIAKVQVKESETLKPSKHYNYKDGMVMEYNIGKMEPGEIRFISYHMKTRLAVIGGLRLKPVIAQYDGRKTYSNPVEVYTP